jgi:hypothetical protein
MGAGDLPEVGGCRDCGKGQELFDIALVGLLGSGIIQVGDPLDFGGNIRELGEVQKRKRALIA